MAQKKKAYISALSSQIIRDIRLGHASSRLELARLHKLAPSTMGIHVDRLIAGGYLTQASVAHHRGRPIQQLSLCGEVGIFIGAEFEARTLHAVCLDFAGRELLRDRATIPPRAKADEVLALVRESIRKLQAQRPEKLLGIGIGSPGLIDPERGVALHYRFIEGWDRIPLVALLQKEFDVPVAMDTNVRSTAVGIQLFEKSFPTDDFICVMVRSGVGAGIVRNGALQPGDSFTAGEVGRILIPGSQPPVVLEDLCSLPAVLRYAREHEARFPPSRLSQPDITNFEIVAEARDGDALAHEAIRQSLTHLAWACHILALVENPRTIVLVGPLSGLGEWLQKELQAALETFTSHARIQLPQIVVTSLGEAVGALGAASLAIEAWEV